MAKNVIEIILKTKGADKAKKEMSGLKKAVGNIGPALAGAGIGFAAFAAAARKTVSLAQEQIRVEKQLDAVIRSTGGAAGMTADEVKALASELQGITNYGDEATIAGENLLLTFTNIGKDVFPQATLTMLDMSTALGQDMKSSAIQLGKALNDPVLGITALSRVGVSFTQQQKEQIKTMAEMGDVAGAQALILAELNKEFGGSAEAAREADGGFIALGNAVGDLGEAIGRGLLPILGDANTGLIAFVENTTVAADESIKAWGFVGDTLGLLGDAYEKASNKGETFRVTGGYLAISQESLATSFKEVVAEERKHENQLAQVDAMTKIYANSTAIAAQETAKLAAQQRQAGLDAQGLRYSMQASQLGSAPVKKNAIEQASYLTGFWQDYREKQLAAEQSTADLSSKAWGDAYDDRFSKTKSAVESVFGAGFNVLGDLGLDLGGEDVGRQVAEDARRLAAIMAGDFNGEAAQLLSQSNPELFKKVMESEDPQELARQILGDFQQGLDPEGLIDRDAAKQRIRAMLFAGEQRQELIDEVVQEMIAEGHNAASVQAAAMQSMGGMFGGAEGEGVGTDMDSAGMAAYQGLSESLQTAAKEGNTMQQLGTIWAAQAKDTDYGRAGSAILSGITNAMFDSANAAAVRQTFISRIIETLVGAGVVAHPMEGR